MTINSDRVVVEGAFIINNTEVRGWGRNVTLIVSPQLAAQTITAIPDQNLDIESTNKLTMFATRDVNVATSMHGIQFSGVKLVQICTDHCHTAAQDLSLIAKTTFPSIFPRLIVQAGTDTFLDITRFPKPQNTSDAYTVCTCPSGRLFLMPKELPCSPISPALASDPCA